MSLTGTKGDFVKFSKNSKANSSSKAKLLSTTLRAAAAVTCLLLAGCTDYWWHRSQPPSVATLMTRAEAKLATSLESASADRQETAALAKQISANLRQTYDTLAHGAHSLPADKLAPIEEALVNLDGKIGVTSRAPYAELCGQFRGFRNAASAGQPLEAAPFGLFAARTISFLASDLNLTAPVGQASAAQADGNGAKKAG